MPLMIRTLVVLSMIMFLSCAVAPNRGLPLCRGHSLDPPPSSGHGDEVVQLYGLATAAWQAGASILAGSSLPEDVVNSLAARFFKGRWAGLALIDRDGTVKALARPQSYRAVSDWVDRLRALKHENKIMRQSLQAISQVQDSNKIYLEINLKDNLLLVKMGNRVLYRFPIVSGKGYAPRTSKRRPYFATPRGIMTIIKKERKPVWHPPAWYWTERGEEVPSSRPALRGVLGNYRLNFGHAYGIHGTAAGRIRPGKHSHGCIRMNNKDLALVYKLVDVGTEVYIY